MHNWTFEELYEENEKKALGLQYTIAERERLKVLFRLLERVIEFNNGKIPLHGPLEINKSLTSSDYAQVIDALLKSGSERYQDIFALLFNNCKRGGFFVEFGACDGLFKNNTYMLEKYFEWTGILAEPDKFWGDRLIKNRSAKIDKRCVSSETGKFIKFYQSNLPGNSSAERANEFLGTVVDSYDVETISLMDLLAQHDAPEYIDFLSVDTEGHEKAVFSNFDFNRYKFGFICVEQNADLPLEARVDPILEKAGYSIIFPREENRPIPMQITAFDKFFVRNDHPALKW